MGEITSIPRRTLLGSLLCFFGRHHWLRLGAVSVVIPTGNALLIRRRHQPVVCDRLGCTARRDEFYDREEAK